MRKLTRNAGRLALHPEHHPRQHGHREQHRDALEDLERPTVHLTSQHLEQDPEPEAEHGRHSYPRPDGPGAVLLVDLPQVAEQDRENEGDLNPFTKRHQK